MTIEVGRKNTCISQLIETLFEIKQKTHHLAVVEHVWTPAQGNNHEKKTQKARSCKLVFELLKMTKKSFEKLFLIDIQFPSTNERGIDF